ncbi:MAG: 3-hexulose-6-phosphate isomerase [Methanomassiliicoccales archaeon PtaU1.Bin124]|nr:MAG: 3-hexulose-6-phosphate isomerase [Methanomassiliicoccales archaeon PtaU1.Bin124]
MKETSAFLLAEVKCAIEKVDDSKVEDIVESITKAKKIFIYGVGRSGLVGQSFAVRLVQMGMDVHFIGDMTTPIVESEDLVIIISNTGETMSAVQTANIVGRIGAKVVVVTSRAHSKLGQAADIILEITPPRNDEKRRQNAPLGTIFELGTAIMLDSLVAVLMQKLGQTEASLRKRHAIWV